MQRYWQAANYLTVGQIYLQENPLLREPLRIEHIKPRLLGHWGTSPGLSFIYVHLNRLIQETGRQHSLYCRARAMAALRSMRILISKAPIPQFTRKSRRTSPAFVFSFANFPLPAAFRAIAARTCPARFTKAASLATRCLHAFGAAFDNPDLIVACVIGDGEAETCPLEGSWKSNRFLNPARDGAVLPILHLNGYKISGPTVEARTRDDELTKLYAGRGYKPYFVEGDDPSSMHQQFAAALDACHAEIRAIQTSAREDRRRTHANGNPSALRSGR